jgi:hypothetical protein
MEEETRLVQTSFKDCTWLEVLLMEIVKSVNVSVE